MNTILVGVDGSAHQDKVIAAARQIAEKQGGRLVLFRAVPLPTELPPRVWAVSPDLVPDLLRTAAEADVDALARALPKELVAGTRVELGAPWRALCDGARAVGADLIVIGSHGYGGVDRLLGTTAAKVVNHADRSVLVVR